MKDFSASPEGVYGNCLLLCIVSSANNVTEVQKA
jgi:hypothetical protein